MATFPTMTDEDIKKQEHLSPEFLKLLELQTYSKKISGRPKESLSELMHWTRDTFFYALKYNTQEQIKEEILINNKITIDGAFLTFCKETNTKVTCLYRDSIASWKDEYDVESFVAQGVFLIEHESVKFIHAALFHKGNQNEDEVSFFIIVHDDHVHKYLEFRNKYDDWTQERDRSNLEVRVIGGDDFSYTRDCSWDSIFLPTKLKKEIKNNIEGFLKSEDIYKKARIPWKRGMLAFGEPGCGKTRLIKTLWSCYDLKPVTISTNAHSSPDDLIKEAFAYASYHAPSLLFLEDINVLLSQINISHFLQLMDGVNSKSGIFVVGTANEISSLSKNITDRPFRFDNKFELPLPDKDMAKSYLQFWFKDLMTDSYALADTVHRNKFSYAYIESIYISSAAIAINKGKSEPDIEDIKKALQLLIEDKKNVKSDFKSENEIGIGI